MSSRPPKLRLHKPTGQAVVTVRVTVDGRERPKDFYCGRYGTAAAKREYARAAAD